MKRLVSDLIHQRELQEMVSVRPESTVSEALNVLIKTNKSAVLVVKNKRLKGIFSEKDFAKASLARGFVLFEKVETVMTSNVFYVEPSFTLEECLQIMSKVHVHHLPVMADDSPIALISMRDIMEVLVEDKENQIRELTTYISGPGAVLEFNQAKRSLNRIPIYPTQRNQEAL